MSAFRDQRAQGERGSLVDVHLLGSVLVSPGAALWSRDKRLTAAARDVGASVFDEHSAATPDPSPKQAREEPHSS